ncbi:unnamed protein product, partial [Nesidiocoris tenuis]
MTWKGLARGRPQMRKLGSANLSKETDLRECRSERKCRTFKTCHSSSELWSRERLRPANDGGYWNSSIHSRPNMTR